LHDKTGRMKAKGVIEAAVPWEQSREFFFWRATRRMAEDDVVGQLRAADARLTKEAATAMLRDLYQGSDWNDNKAVAGFFEAMSNQIAGVVNKVKVAGVQAKIDALTTELDALK
jgi:acetyl-CoA carboxylase / biotin carboxylase 1